MKKPFYKRWWFIAIVVIIIIGAIGSGGDNETEEAKKEDKKEVAEIENVIEAEEILDEEETEVKEEMEVNQEDLEKLFLGIMEENFDGLADVTYNKDNKAFILLPTDEDLIKELISLVTGNENMLKGWDTLVDGILVMSESLKNNLGNGYSVHLLNPANKDNVLLSLLDGIVFYNVADDL